MSDPLPDLVRPAHREPVATSASQVPGAALTLGHVLVGMGAYHVPAVDPQDILVIRHTYNPCDPEALRGPEDLTLERVLAYTRELSGWAPVSSPACCDS